MSDLFLCYQNIYNSLDVTDTEKNRKEIVGELYFEVSNEHEFKFLTSADNFYV